MNLTTYQPVNYRDEHPLTAELRDVVITADRTAPRSLQIALGPSEIGEPCARKLAYRLMDEPHTNTTSDPWPAIVGTSVHAWLANAFTNTNKTAGRIKYLVETRVTIRTGLEGNGDLYDVDRATVIDHKIVGPTTLKNYRLNGPSQQYRVQVHGYGKGYRRLGLPVEHVAIAFFPRSSDLSGLYVWSEPYNETIINDALQRHDDLLELVCAIDLEHNTTNYRLIPTSPSHRCTYCPWFKPGPDTGTGCPGNSNGTGDKTWN